MATTSLNAVPETVNITAYGGDTLRIEVTVAAGIADGLDWNAQIRADRTAATVDASFAIVPPSSPGAKAILTLPATVSTALIGALPEYKGVWDCQVSDGGADPVITLIQGTFNLKIDVTRIGP